LFDSIAIISILIALGVGAGTLGSLVGVGGGIIMVPVLTYMGFSPSQIASTSLLAVTSTSASSTLEYAKQKRIDYSTGLKMAIFAIPGSVLGAFLAGLISLESFKLYFAILLILTGIYLLYRNSARAKTAYDGQADVTVPAKPSSLSYLLMFAGTFFSGIISSLFGVGGGIIFVPMMLLIFGMKMFRAAPTSQFIILISSLSGFFTHAFLGHPDYVQALSLAAGSFVGGQLGARISKSAKESLLHKILAFALVGVGIRFVVEWLYTVLK